LESSQFGPLFHVEQDRVRPSAWFHVEHLRDRPVGHLSFLRAWLRQA